MTEGDTSWRSLIYTHFDRDSRCVATRFRVATRKARPEVGDPSLLSMAGRVGGA